MTNMETILIVNAGSSSLAFVFTAGIGENSATMRARIADKLDWLGALNPGGECGPAALLISRPDSRVPLYEIPTDEELMIARHTLSVLSRDAARALVSENVARRRFAS